MDDRVKRLGINRCYGRPAFPRNPEVDARGSIGSKRDNLRFAADMVVRHVLRDSITRTGAESVGTGLKG